MSAKTIVPAALLAVLSMPALAVDNIELFHQRVPASYNWRVSARKGVRLGSGVACLTEPRHQPPCHQRAKYSVPRRRLWATSNAPDFGCFARPVCAVSRAWGCGPRLSAAHAS